MSPTIRFFIAFNVFSTYNLFIKSKVVLCLIFDQDEQNKLKSRKKQTYSCTHIASQAMASNDQSPHPRFVNIRPQSYDVTAHDVNVVKAIIIMHTHYLLEDAW